MTARRNFTDKVHATTYDYISPLHHDLQGRHVLITGAAWEDGVGHATAIAFARASASVIAMADLHGVSDDLITKVETAALDINRTKPTVIAYTVDISDLESVKNMSQAFE
jgi:NAD(P)-dependent dehydrogenase (short-subunit alcohol dehydrogenase family)